MIPHRSMHNTRIEQLWLESGCHFARAWRAFFTRLERLYSLDRDDPQHIWLLHSLFLDDIQHDCHDFQMHWNNHPLSGKGKNMSPLVSANGQYMPLIPGVDDALSRISNSPVRLSMVSMIRSTTSIQSCFAATMEHPQIITTIPPLSAQLIPKRALLTLRLKLNWTKTTVQP